MEKALSIRDLTKTYKNGVVALKGIDLDVEPRELVFVRHLEMGR